MNPRHVVFSTPLSPRPSQPQISPSAPILKHTQTVFLPQCERPSFTLIQNNRQNYSLYLNLYILGWQKSRQRFWTGLWRVTSEWGFLSTGQKTVCYSALLFAARKWAEVRANWCRIGNETCGTLWKRIYIVISSVGTNSTANITASYSERADVSQNKLNNLIIFKLLPHHKMYRMI